MPEPISTSRSSINACFPPDEEPQMSVDPSGSGGMSVAPPAPSKPTPGGPVSTPSTPISLKSGTAVLVAGHTTITAKGALGSLAPGGAGNVGARAAVADGSVTITDAATKTTTTAQLAFGTAELNVGTQNVDGSTGAHLKAGAALYSAEVTTGTPGFQLTVGVDVGVGIEASSGERDLDGDGRTEYCFRAGTAVLAGFCAEPGQLLADAKGALEVLEKIVAGAHYPGVQP
jgi:hypothetical protein